ALEARAQTAPASGQGTVTPDQGQINSANPPGTTLPPGLEKRDQLPPGLQGRDQLPPGLANRNDQFGLGTNQFGVATNQFGTQTNQFGNTNQFGFATNYLQGAPNQFGTISNQLSTGAGSQLGFTTNQSGLSPVGFA